MGGEERNQEEITAQNLASSLRLPYFDGRRAANLATVVGVMNVKDARDYKIVPFSLVNGRLDLGVAASADRGRIALLKQKFPDYSPIFSIVSDSSFDDIIKYLDSAELIKLTSGSIAELTEHIKSSKSADAFRLIVQRAYLMRASDIHIEPKAASALVRFRIDGTLHDIMVLPIESYKTFLSSIQIAAKMSWGTAKPQSGRMNQDLFDREHKPVTLNVRLESIPTLHGEEIIARLLTMDPAYLDLEKMQFEPPQRAALDRILASPHGMIMVVGPTNSGKTSLLYAIINKINNPETKVVTLEDPIEYELPGASQIPVQTENKESFTEMLRAVLREDPNVIMLGEIRDVDTAKTSLQAALTGHLVLSTYHANSTAAAVARITDLIGHNSLLPSAIRMIIAERLVRRVCPHCPEQYAATKEQIEHINKIMVGVAKEIYDPPQNLNLTKGKGCKFCNNFGFLGRIALFEQLIISEQLEDLITTNSEKLTARNIEQQAKREGMLTLLQDGVLKAIAGQTTPEEVYRVIENK